MPNILYKALTDINHMSVFTNFHKWNKFHKFNGLPSYMPNRKLSISLTSVSDL